MRALALLLVLTLLAGCIRGGDDAVEPASDANATAPPAASNATLPDGRGESLGNKETNRTEEGVGGVEHRHDYWAGREQAIVFQRDVTFAPFPFFPEGKGSTPKGVAYISLPEGSLVYEGTDKVVVVAAARIRDQTHPQPAALRLQYRTAADAAWREPVNLALGQPFEIPVEAKETDMPHSTASLWNFRLVADRPSALVVEAFNVTVTAYKGREVVDWPGHPDFYAETSERVVLDGDFRSHQYGFPEDGFYEDMDGWIEPTKLVSYGTGLLNVYVNVTTFASTPPIPATEYVLNVHNATLLSTECCSDVYRDAEGKNDLKSYHFVVPVDTAGMDSPYQPASRWGFRLAAVTGAFTDSSTYDVDYHMTIVARKAETSAPLPP